MATAINQGFQESVVEGFVLRRPQQHHRRWTTALLAGAITVVVLAGPGDRGSALPGLGSSTSDGSDAWSRRLQAEAEAYFADQANRERGWVADSARLQAAADASR